MLDSSRILVQYTVGQVASPSEEGKAKEGKWLFPYMDNKRSMKTIIQYYAYVQAVNTSQGLGGGGVYRMLLHYYGWVWLGLLLG